MESCEVGDSMRQLKDILNNQQGYTLLEMIIVIGLIGVGLGLTSFGLNVIFNANVNSYSQQIVSEIKNVQVKEMAAKSKDFSMEIRYVTDHYELYIISTDTAAAVSTNKTIAFPTSIVIEKETAPGTFVELKDPIFTPDKRSFAFSEGTGKLVTNGEGTYRVTAVNSDLTRLIRVYKQNGRVVVEQ